MAMESCRIIDCNHGEFVVARRERGIFQLQSRLSPLSEITTIGIRLTVSPDDPGSTMFLMESGFLKLSIETPLGGPTAAPSPRLGSRGNVQVEAPPCQSPLSSVESEASPVQL
jgi:hypothetical protein